MPCSPQRRGTIQKQSLRLAQPPDHRVDRVVVKRLESPDARIAFDYETRISSVPNPYQICALKPELVLRDLPGKLVQWGLQSPSFLGRDPA
jgi:hypothetical protein